MAECYYEIQDFPGYYIKEEQDVYSRWQRGKAFKFFIGDIWKKLTPTNCGGYLEVALRRDGQTYHRRIHRLMLETFVGPRPDGMEGCHRDGNSLNNDITNLYWGTRQQNAQDAVRHGTTAFGEKNGHADLTNELVFEILRLRSLGHSQLSIAEAVGTTKGNVSDILRGNTWGRITGLPQMESTKKMQLVKGDVTEVLRLSRLGMRQVDIAKEVGCSQVNVSCILTGKTWSGFTGIQPKPKGSPRRSKYS